MRTTGGLRKTSVMHPLGKFWSFSLLAAIIFGLSACGPEPAAKQALKWADDGARAIRGADEAAEASQAVKRTPPAAADAEARRLMGALEEEWRDALCDGADILVKAVEAGESANFDWSDWAAEQLRPGLESNFTDEQIDGVAGQLIRVLDSLENNTEVLKGVADACGIAENI